MFSVFFPQFCGDTTDRERLASVAGGRRTTPEGDVEFLLVGGAR
jgi:hypothetical protein